MTTLPKVGSRWVWEIEQPLGRVLVEVNEVAWNGEEWWVTTRTLPEAPTPMFASPPAEPQVHRNELDRFWEAVQPVGGSRRELTERRDD